MPSIRPRTGLHHTHDDRGPRSLHRLGAFALGAAAALVGCSDPVATRFDQHTAAATRAFGDDDRLTVEVAPGRALAAEVDADAQAVRVHASAPWPTVTLANGTVTDQAVELAVENVSAAARVVATQGPLGPTGRRDVRCSDSAYADQPALIVPAPTLRFDEDATTAGLTAVLPPCTRLDIAWAPPPDAASVRVVVIPDAGADASRLRNAIATALERAPDAIAVLGGVVGRGGDTDAAVRVLDEADVPYVVSIGAADANRSPAAFRREFGQSDWQIEVGNATWLVLDTADGQLADAQFRLIESDAAPRGSGVLLTDTAPFGAQGSTPFRSRQQATRLANVLSERAVADVVGNADTAPGRITWADLDVHTLQPIARGSRLLELTFDAPWSEAPTIRLEPLTD